jgi:hypothetical protein
MFTIDYSKTHDKIQHISLWIVLGPMGTDKIQHISLWTDKIQHKAKLLDLWGLLLLFSYFSIKKMMVAGDSKVTIDWINSKSNLNLIYLNNWKDKIRSLNNIFESIKFIYVHR